MRRTTRGAALAGAVVLAACGSATKTVKVAETAASTTTTSTTAPASTTASSTSTTIAPSTTTTAAAITTTPPAIVTKAYDQVEPANAAIVVVNPGKAPRAPLRYAVPKDTSWKIRINQNQTITIDGLGKHQTVPSRATTRTGFTVIDASGGASTVRVQYEAITGAGAGADVLKDLVIDLTTDSQGRVTQVATNAEQLADPTIDSVLASVVPALTGAAIVLPDAPVGVGAHWRQTSDVVFTAGARLTQVLDVTLAAINGSKLDLTITGTYKKSTAPPPSDPATPRVDTVKGTTTATATSDLTGPGPVSKETGDIDITMSAVQDGTRQPLHLVVHEENDRTLA
jgi:hypothetical protein